MTAREQTPTSSMTVARFPSRGGLSAERVYAAALQILDTGGPDALSMRGLAHALDREAMTLYRYAPNKAAVLDGVVELVLGELHVDRDAADWCEALRELARAFRRTALAHPHVVPLMVTRPVATPLGLRPAGTLQPLEDILDLLTRAGFTPADALHAYRLFFGFLHGHVLSELQEVVDDPDQADDQLQANLHRLPRRQFPQVRALAAELANYDGAAQLEQGVELMIIGLQNRFQPEHASQASTTPA